MKDDFQVMENKREFSINRQIEVDDKRSELIVKIVVDTVKATFKVTTSIESKNVSYQNPELTGAVIEQLADMLEQGVIKAQEIITELVSVDYDPDLVVTLFTPQKQIG